MKQISDRSSCDDKKYRASGVGSFIIVFLVILSFASAYFVSSKYYQVMLIQGDSMYPAFHNMQIVLIDKRDNDFSCGDVVAFDCRGLDSVLVKRIVAASGDSVFIENGSLYVNGRLSKMYDEHIFEDSGILGSEIILSENEYIVIGDNVQFSVDSRFPAVGIVDAGDIIGRIAE